MKNFKTLSTELMERELTSDEMKKKEEIVKALKDSGDYDLDDPEQKAKMYAIATAQAKKSA